MDLTKANYRPLIIWIINECLNFDWPCTSVTVEYTWPIVVTLCEVFCNLNLAPGLDFIENCICNFRRRKSSHYFQSVPCIFESELTGIELTVKCISPSQYLCKIQMGNSYKKKDKARITFLRLGFCLFSLWFFKHFWLWNSIALDYRQDG